MTNFLETLLHLPHCNLAGGSWGCHHESIDLVSIHPFQIFSQTQRPMILTAPKHAPYQNNSRCHVNKWHMKPQIALCSLSSGAESFIFHFEMSDMIFGDSADFVWLSSKSISLNSTSVLTNEPISVLFKFIFENFSIKTQMRAIRLTPELFQKK